MDLTELVLIAAALTGIAGVFVHWYGWLPKRYLKALGKAQTGFAASVSAELKGALAGSAAELALLRQDLKDTMERLGSLELNMAPLAGPLGEAVTAAVAPLGDRLHAAVQEGFGTMTGALVDAYAKTGYQGMQAAGVASRAEASAAKVGARKMLAALAGQVHPLAGTAVGIAQSLGVIDDGMAEQIATFLLDNPEIMAAVNRAGARVAEARGITAEGNGSYAPGLPGRR